MLQADSSRRSQQLWDANEVAGCGGEYEEPLDQAATAMPRLAQAADRLDPTERLLDQLALDRPILVGWSYGGYIVSDYVRKKGQGKIAGIVYRSSESAM